MLPEAKKGESGRKQRRTEAQCGNSDSKFASRTIAMNYRYRFWVFSFRFVFVSLFLVNSILNLSSGCGEESGSEERNSVVSGSSSDLNLKWRLGFAIVPFTGPRILRFMAQSLGPKPCHGLFWVFQVSFWFVFGIYFLFIMLYLSFDFIDKN